MPDDFAPTPMPEGAPRSWGEAFALLPMESPAGDGWSRLAHALDAPASRQRAVRRERRLSWTIGIASAAVLVLAVWSPLSQWLGRGDARSAAVATVPAGHGPVDAAQTAPQQSTAKILDAPPQATAVELQAAPQRKPAAHRNPASRPRTHVARSTAPQTTASPVSDAAASASPDRGLAANDPLQALKTQSAQLEALVAMARDDRVGNVSNALLSGELDAGIAVVDAALSQGDLTPSRRQELWQQRVDLLQQLAGVEATSRWLAAQGASNETLLVSVD